MTDPQFAADHPEAVEFLTGYTGRSTFVLDLRRKMERFGSLSERQLACIERDMSRAREVADSPPAPDGSAIFVTGTVVSVKYAKFGLGFTVRLDNGNRVWCSVPKGSEPVVGQRASFTASFQRAQNDPHFAFGKKLRDVNLYAIEDAA